MKTKSKLPPLAIIGKGRFSIYAWKENRERWAVSTAVKKIGERVPDRWFNIHKPELWESWLKKTPCILPSGYDSYPETAEILDYEKIKEVFEGPFTSSVSWVLAWAVIRGYTDIKLFGVDMMNATEYAEQRDGLFWIAGQAVGMGVKIDFVKDCGVYLDKNTEYGRVKK